MADVVSKYQTIASFFPP